MKFAILSFDSATVSTQEHTRNLLNDDAVIRWRGATAARSPANVPEMHKKTRREEIEEK